MNKNNYKFVNNKYKQRDVYFKTNKGNKNNKGTFVKLLYTAPEMLIQCGITSTCTIFFSRHIP